MENIIKSVALLLEKKPDAVIAIDGPCASGKTTLARLLAEKFRIQVIHMDDFFLPAALRTEERLAEHGGNVHYERFCKEVVSGIKSGKAFEYRAYSCRTGDYKETKKISPHQAILVEGSYSLHPEFSEIYDMKIFVVADPETRHERILQRNGETALETFKSLWIPLEDKYFEHFGIMKNCDIILKTDQKQ